MSLFILVLISLDISKSVIHIDYLYLNIYLACMDVCLSVCVYPINGKTTEPIRPNFFAATHITPEDVYENVDICYF